MDTTILDNVLRVLTAIGLPAVILWFLRERRNQAANDREAEAQADVSEAEVPLRVRSSSVVTLEAEIAALSRTFQDDRKLKQDTIDWLTAQLDAERRANVAKDRRIRELEAKFQGLQTRFDEVSEDLKRVSHDLRSLHDDKPNTD